MDIASAFSEVKSLPDDALHRELANPTGMIPGYLVLSEIQDRKSLRLEHTPTKAARRPSMIDEIKTKGYSRGGMIAAMTPLKSLTEGLKYYKNLAFNDPDEGLAGLNAPPPLMQPLPIGYFEPQQPEKLKPLKPAGMSNGGLVSLQPYQRQLLDAIAARESPAYNVMYGGRRFYDYSRHPGIAVPIRSGPNAGKTSSAAGRYQFLQSTWNKYQKKLHLPDFSPASQDQGAWALAKDAYYAKTGGGNLDAALLSNDPRQIAGVGRALNGTWTSLPGGIEQGQGVNEFVKRFMGAPGTVPAGAVANAANVANAGGIAALGMNPAMTKTVGMAPLLGPARGAMVPVAPSVQPSPMGGLMSIFMQAMAARNAVPASQTVNVDGPSPEAKKMAMAVPQKSPEEIVEETSMTPGYYRRRRANG